MTSKTPLPSDENKAMAAMFKHMAEHGGGPAYPMQMELGKAENGEPFVWFTVGLTKREKLAAMAMQGFIAYGTQWWSSDENRVKLAENSVLCADALLERLKQ